MTRLQQAGTLAQMRVLVVGCGAIGGVVSAYLSELGAAELSVLTTNPSIAEALTSRGFRVRAPELPESVPAPSVLTELDKSVAPFDCILLATQPPQVEQAARAARDWLVADGRIVCFQNGLCEERVAAIVGPERVVGGVVAWGASMLEPGVYDRTSAGGFVLGRLDGEIDAQLERLSLLFESIGPVTLTRNLRGARWSKLAINAVISTLGTIGGDTLGTLIRYRHVRRLGLEVMTETVAVARAEAVELEKVSGTIDLNWVALTESERRASGSPSLVAKHSLLLAVGARYRRLRSSMLAAIERGKPPAVDFLNGEIVERGKKHGIAVPINQRAQDTVWRIARGEERAAHDTLRRLYDETR